MFVSFSSLMRTKMKTQGNDSGHLSKQLLSPTPKWSVIVTDGMESETFPPTLTVNCLRAGTRRQSLHEGDFQQEWLKHWPGF